MGGNPTTQIYIIMKRTNEKCYVKTQLQRICNDEGESIEETLRRLTANKEPIPQNVPPIYTPLSEGVMADTDIRTDRFDIAIEAQDKFAASEAAKGAAAAKEQQAQIDKLNSQEQQQIAE